MIERYSTDAMTELWSDENRYSTWLEVELAVCRAWMEDGLVPPGDLKTIEERASIDVKRITEIENEVHHDVIAFVSSLTEKTGPSGRFIHMGLTSSDVLDTAASIVITRGIDILVSALDELMDSLLRAAWKYRYTPCAGRTHGIHAEPLSFGLKILNWYSQAGRDRERLEAARRHISVGKISGAVGTYAHCPPHIEERVCELLGLSPAPVSSQILQRDRHAEVLYAIASLGAGLERIATEIRHLQRTEVLEAAEPFGRGQKGSSAMPHKRNPILCERICGMARLLRSYSNSALENIALWHERDISHSSVERVIWPDGFHLAHYMLLKMLDIVSGMDVYPESMADNLDLTGGLVYSQRVLLELVKKGMTREQAYSVVQENAMHCWSGNKSFRELLINDPRVHEKMEREELETLFDNDYFLRFVDTVFERFPDPS